jgi:hypothetical protein
MNKLKKIESSKLLHILLKYQFTIEMELVISDFAESVKKSFSMINHDFTTSVIIADTIKQIIKEIGEEYLIKDIRYIIAIYAVDIIELKVSANKIINTLSLVFKNNELKMYCSIRVELNTKTNSELCYYKPKQEKYKRIYEFLKVCVDSVLIDL